jgi:hypothetical protein
VASIVGVHGIGKQFLGENLLRKEWLPALQDGLNRVDPSLAAGVDLTCAFYGDLFRPKGDKAVGDPPYTAADVDDPLEEELLVTWAAEVDRIEGGEAMEGPTKAFSRTPRSVQWALDVLSESRFFVGLVERAVIADLKQVRAYLRVSGIREQVQARIAAVVGHDTKVLIGHSLGSVAAYEALCAHPEWPVRGLVTLGSPLGIRNLIFDKLRPPPSNGRGAWPGSVALWVNVADGGDVVALVKALAPRFGERVRDESVHNGATAHNVTPYLTAEETGRAVADSLGA